MSVKDAPDFCAELVRNHDFVRYASTLFVPVEQRRPLLALYAFNAEVNRIREQVSQPLPGEVRLQWWTDMLLGAGHGGVEGNPVASELLRAIQTFRLPVERLTRLVEEHQFDVYNDPMPTLSALEGYVNDTSSGLFALAGRIAGPPSAETDHLARHAGLAFGFVQAINAMPRDAVRRQLFVPLQLLEKHGSGMEQVLSGKQTPQARAAIDELVAAARRHLEAALALLAEAPAELRSIFLPLVIARADLTRLSRADNDPFVPHFRSRFSTLWMTWRASRSALFKPR
jgi:15-cis-phytoene synthase